MNKTSLLNASGLTVLAALLCVAQPALAQSANLTLWTAAGDVLVQSPTSALLTTASTLSDETPLTSNSALLFDALETALSIPGATAGDTLEGSGLEHSFITATGATVSFDWTLSTVPGTLPFDPAYADRAFVVINGAPAVDFAVAGPGALSGSFSYTFPSAGSYSLAVLVMDVGDTVEVSTLALSNLSVTAVPEASTVALMLGGLALLGATARRRRG